MDGVTVRLKISDTFLVPKFHDCIVTLLQESSKNKVDVDLQLVGDTLIVTRAPRHGNKPIDFSYTLQHSCECPLKNLTTGDTTLEQSNLHIPVAVCVILESSDHHVLLTKRATTLTSSPGTWVPPGGHLDKNESVLAGGLREVFEETGLRFHEKDVLRKRIYNVLGLWENVYPIILGFGKPQRHSLVIYYRLLCNKTHVELNRKININRKEVEAYAWIPPKIFKEIFSSTDKLSHTQYQYVFHNGQLRRRNLDYLKMFPRAMWSGNNVYSGVQFALSAWYKLYCHENHKDSGPTSKF